MVANKVFMDLPDAMSFSVNYLGANITQVGLNFSRPAAQILGARRRQKRAQWALF